LNLLVRNVVKCPPRYAKLISGDLDFHVEFVKGVAEDFQKSERTGLEKVPEDLISDDDFSRQSQGSTELPLVTDMPKVYYRPPKTNNDIVLPYRRPIHNTAMNGCAGPYVISAVAPSMDKVSCFMWTTS